MASSLSKASAYRAESIKVRCEACLYQELCIYRRAVEDAVRSIAHELRGDDWSPGDDPVITTIDIRDCARYNSK